MRKRTTAAALALLLAITPLLTGCAGEPAAPDPSPTEITTPPAALLPEEPEKEEGTCEGCPYGKHAPCIGFCLLKIVRELKIKV